MPPPPTRVLNDNRGSPKNPFLDGTGLTDLVQKAEAMNIKVWTVKSRCHFDDVEGRTDLVSELTEMLARLAPLEITLTNDSLHTLLEDERLHGTRERDLNAPRPDYYYYKPGSKYLLLEDATAKHRTIMVKEYPYSQKEVQEWPTLYEGFLRVSSSMQTTTPIDKIRDRAWALYVNRVPFEGEQPPADLKRSMSLRSLPATPKLPEVQSYQNASGNSVVITSNVASTSTANQSPNLIGGVPALGQAKDRAIIQMSKRVQVLKGNARLAAAKRQQTDDLDLTSLPHRRASTGHVPAPPLRTFMTQEQVISMLQQAREPICETKPTVEERVRNRERVQAGLKGRDQVTAPGYCENCRLRYSDLSVVCPHVYLSFSIRLLIEDPAHRVEETSAIRNQCRKFRRARRPLVRSRTTDQSRHVHHRLPTLSGSAS